MLTGLLTALGTNYFFICRMEEYPYTNPMGRTRFVPQENTQRMNVIFSPSLALQRYSAVLDCLTKAAEKDDIRIVTEYGPNSCRFLYQALETTSWLEQINLVDVNAEIISTSYQNLCEPRWNRTKRGRIRKLTALAYQGNIACSDYRVSNSDAVIGIELIEHLTTSDFNEFPQNVFGYIQPKYVVFTTPNGEFNVLFNRPNGEFRHHDHKFEFTRAECQKWAQDIVDNYPSYDFKIYGIGAPPDNVGDVGFASQMIIFQRTSEPVPIFHSMESYNLIGEIVLNYGDNRTSEEKYLTKLANSSSRLICDFMYELAHSVYMRQERCREGHSMDAVPVKMVVKYLEKEDIFTDVDTVVMAVRKYSSISYEVEMTLALGPVFVDKCECDGSFHEEYPMYNPNVPPSSFFYALPSYDLSINNVSLLKNVVESIEICHYIGQFLEAAANLREFLLVTTRETCTQRHSVSFLTPEIVVAHLKAGGIETDSKTVLKVWRENESKKYFLEETSFGYVIIIEKYCGDSPCTSDPEDSLEWDDECGCIASPCIPNSEDNLKCCDERFFIDSAEE